MKTSTLIALVSVAAVLAAVTGCSKTQEIESKAEETKITNVETFLVKKSTYDDYIHLPVVTKPNKEVNLGLTNGGKVTKIHVDKGDRVKEGMVLLETDDVLLKAVCDMAKSNLEFQEKDFARNEKLYREGSISETVYDGSKLALSQAQSNYEQAKKMFEEAVLKAPFAGIVTSRNVEVGDILSPGMPAFRIIDVNTVKVQAGIPEKYIVDFKVGNTVEITFDAIPGKTFGGKIHYIAPEANSSVRTFLAEIIVNNQNGLIRAGIMGDAHILKKKYDDALVVPMDALIDTQNGRILFVARDNNTAEERLVTTGSSSDDVVMITSGLTAGEKVIIKGQHDLVDGESINVTGDYQSKSREGVQ